MDIYDSILKPALLEIQQSMGARGSFQVTPDLVLLGENAAMDSLSFVSFVVLVEEKIYDVTGKSITLVDDKAFSSRNSPFRTLNSFQDFVREKITNEQ